MTITIAVDCMGGDHGLSVTIPAACQFLQQRSDAKLLLAGHPDQIKQALSLHATSKFRERFDIIEATEVVTMDDSPMHALRRKKNSSLHRVIEQVRDKHADACLSAGNTGALMAIAQVMLRTIEGIERAALATAMPNMQGKSTTVLDLGANVDCEAVHLRDFGIMGSAFVSVVEQISKPSVGLLNVGQEDIKGNQVVKQASEYLKATALNFIGNVEGDDIFKGTSDVVVCDGFVGNVVLKSIEGLAKMVKASLEQEFRSDPFSLMLGALASPTVMKRFKNRINPSRYNGACLLGVNGIVFKSHGSASAEGFECALNRTYDAAKHKLLDAIRTNIAAIKTATDPQVRSPE